MLGKKKLRSYFQTVTYSDDFICGYKGGRNTVNVSSQASFSCSCCYNKLFLSEFAHVSFVSGKYHRQRGGKKSNLWKRQLQDIKQKCRNINNDQTS